MSGSKVRETAMSVLSTGPLRNTQLTSFPSTIVTGGASQYVAATLATGRQLRNSLDGQPTW